MIFRNSQYVLAKRAGVLLATLICSVSSASAIQHALVIGIDTYESPLINPLRAAGADARGLATFLQTSAKVPGANVRLLTSAGSLKPRKKVILEEIEKLAKSVKPGDTVFFSFAGHGMQLRGGEPALLPMDANLTNDATAKETTLSAAEIRSALSKIPAELLIVMYDMCRNDPIAGSRQSGGNFMGSNLARATSLETVSGNQPGPKNVVNLFSCSPSQLSYEWTGKGRGFFSYYVEQGLAGSAANSEGKVTVTTLLNYLNLAVPGVVQREVGREQTPMFELRGKDVLGQVVLSGRKPGGGGLTAVVMANPNLKPKTYEDLFQLGYEAALSGRSLAAEDYFQDALKLKPNSVQAMIGIAKAFHLGGDTRTAQQWYAKAVKADPKNQEAWVLGYSISTEGHMIDPFKFDRNVNGQFVERWDKIVALDKRNPYAWFMSGIFSVLALDLQSRARAFRAIKELVPADHPYVQMVYPDPLQLVEKEDWTTLELLHSDRSTVEIHNDAKFVNIAEKRVDEEPDHLALWAFLYTNRGMWRERKQGKQGSGVTWSLRELPERGAAFQKKAEQAFERLNLNRDARRPLRPLPEEQARLELASIQGMYANIMSPFQDFKSGVRYGLRVFWDQAEKRSFDNRVVPLGNGNFLIDDSMSGGPYRVYTRLASNLLVSEEGVVIIRIL
ncbi:MAG: caspase family protein [Fimbriimonadaceae bacterium]|jgi:tetratricopeptide (TPR) repeat protein|nr:caspase family protein [Fimbriimonadaceae bacterium]